MYFSMIVCLCFTQTEPEFVELHSFIKDLQSIARPHSLFSPTTALKTKRSEELKAAFADQHHSVDLELSSTVVDINWKAGVATIELAPMLTRWKKTGNDVPLSLSENSILEVVMPQEVASKVLKEERVTINAHCLKVSAGVAGSGPPHGQFLFSASSKRFGVSIGSYVTSNYTVTLPGRGTFKGYWDQTATQQPNKQQSVEANF